jgi:hypothetical protein
LLSYTGFFVEERDGLYEVKPEGEPYDPLKQAYFVPKSALSEYTNEEKVYINGRLVHHYLHRPLIQASLILLRS